MSVRASPYLPVPTATNSTLGQTSFQKLPPDTIAMFSCYDCGSLYRPALPFSDAMPGTDATVHLTIGFELVSENNIL